ncbi:hypothetical protein [Mesorhizobium sp. f-mel]
MQQAMVAWTMHHHVQSLGHVSPGRRAFPILPRWTSTSMPGQVEPAGSARFLISDHPVVFSIDLVEHCLEIEPSAILADRVEVVLRTRVQDPTATILFAI